MQSSPEPVFSKSCPKPSLLGPVVGDIKGVTFVGSTSVGRHIYKTAAAHDKRVQALCEAKNHALVLKDCNLEKTVAGIANATCGCAGERCMALPVLVVEEEIADEFKSSEADFLVTTEKDAIRLRHLDLLDMPVYAVIQEVCSEEEGRFREWLNTRLPKIQAGRQS